jgi:hypothetical protein
MLTKSREVRRRSGDRFTHPLAAGAKAFKGALIVLDGSLAKPGLIKAGLTVAGVAENPADNTGGADGAVMVDCRRDGLFHFETSVADPITRADINARCFIEDDETVSRTDDGGNRSAAGIIRDVEGTRIWVEFE